MRFKEKTFSIVHKKTQIITQTNIFRQSQIKFRKIEKEIKKCNEREKDKENGEGEMRILSETELPDTSNKTLI